MHARWICGLASVLAMLLSGVVTAGERDVRFSIVGRFRDDEPLESRTKRNLELRELIREATAREQPPLHLGEVAFDLEKILPVPNADGKNIGPWTIYFTEQDRPHVVQLKDDLVRLSAKIVSSGWPVRVWSRCRNW